MARAPNPSATAGPHSGSTSGETATSPAVPTPIAPSDIHEAAVTSDGRRRRVAAPTRSDRAPNERAVMNAKSARSQLRPVERAGQAAPTTAAAATVAAAPSLEAPARSAAPNIVMPMASHGPSTGSKAKRATASSAAAETPAAARPPQIQVVSRGRSKKRNHTATAMLSAPKASAVAETISGSVHSCHVTSEIHDAAAATTPVHW